jgi:hypothetical protein
MVALGKVVLTSREHMIMLEARDNGMMGVTLRYPYEVRASKEYFDEIDKEKVPKDMLDLALHIVETKKGAFPTHTEILDVISESRRFRRCAPFGPLLRIRQRSKHTFGRGWRGSFENKGGVIDAFSHVFLESS